MIVNKIKVISYNIQKIGSNPTKLFHFLNIYKNENPDIICLSEFDCNINAFTIIKEKLKKNHYNITKTKKEDKTCIIYKESIRIESINNIKNKTQFPFNNYFNDISIKYGNDILTVISVYVPVYLSKNSNKRDNITKFDFLESFNKILENQLHKFNHGYIITGDWNTRAIESEHISTKESTVHNNLFKLKLTDIFFLGKNKKQIQYTNIPTNKASTRNRLDRCYVNAKLIKSLKISYKVSLKIKMSTHFPIITSFTERQNNKSADNLSPLYSKLETHFHDFLSFQSNILLNITPNNSEIPMINPLIDFETLKYRLHSNKHNLMKALIFYPPFIDFCENPPTTDGYYARLRRRFGKNETDFILENQTTIEATDFYKNLFEKKHQPVNDHFFNYFTENFKEAITKEESRKLENKITEAELWKTLNLIIKNGSSSPGMDRITFHHWKSIWKKVAPKVCNLANFTFDGNLHANAAINTIMIKLIAKKSFSNKKPSINELRPISLTNTIVRLINFCLTQRMMPIFNRIIAYPQQAFLKSRSIHINIQLTRLLAKDISLNFKEDKRNILMIDLRKAFDTLNHNYIQRILEHIKMPAKITKMIMQQCSGSHGHIMNSNKYFKTPIKFESGVRQGLPFSPLLFNLCLEPLINTLLLKLQGIHLKERLITSLSRDSASRRQFNLVNTKILAFADDIVIFNNNFKETKHALAIVENFGEISQLRINFDKSQLLSNRNSAEKLKQYLRKNVSKTIPVHDIQINPVYLGIPILEINWPEKIKQLKNRINRILFLDLNIYERVTAFNTYIYSTIYYVDEHHCLNNESIMEFTDFCKTAILQGSRIPRNRVHWHALIHKGGLNLINLEQQLQGRRATYIGTILTESGNNTNAIKHPFSTVLKFQLQQSLDRIIQLDYLQYSLTQHIIEAYEDNTRINIDQLINEVPGVFYKKHIHTIPFQEMLKSNRLHTRKEHSVDILKMLEEIGHKQEFHINLSRIQRNEQMKTTIKAIEYMNQLARLTPLVKRIPTTKENLDIVLEDDRIFNLSYETPIHYHNIKYYLRAWYQLTVFKDNNVNSPKFHSYTIQDYFTMINTNIPTTDGSFKSIHTNQAISLPDDLRQTSKKFSSKLPDVSFDYWKTKNVEEEDHPKLMKRLQKMNYLNSNQVINILMTQNGLINKRFYHRCPLCEGKGGTHHIFFNCEKAKALTQMFGHNVTLANVLKNKQTSQEIVALNKMIGFLVYAQTKYWVKRKNNEKISAQMDKELYIQFKYESQTTEL